MGLTRRSVLGAGLDHRLQRADPRFSLASKGEEHRREVL
jgi:hypothetical protein